MFYALLSNLKISNQIGSNWNLVQLLHKSVMILSLNTDDDYQLLGPCKFLLTQNDARRVVIIDEHIIRYVVPFTRRFMNDTTTSVIWKDIYCVMRNLDQDGISVFRKECPQFERDVVDTIIWNKNPTIKSTKSRWEDWKDAVECALIFKDPVVSHLTRDCTTFNKQIAGLLDQLELFNDQNTEGLLIEQESHIQREPAKYTLNTEINVLKIFSSLWTSDVGVATMSAQNITHFCRVLLEMLSFLKLASIKTDEILIPVIRSLLFSFADQARVALLSCRSKQWNSSSKWIGLPIGSAREIDFATPTVSLMHSLCTWDLIDAYPEIIIAIIKAHAALSTIPRPVSIPSPPKTDDDYAVTSLLNGFDAQHEWVGTLLITVYNRVLDESIDFLQRPSLRKR